MRVALLQYEDDTVSIISFIRNSLVPISEHLYFYCYAEVFCFEYFFLELSKYGKKGPFASCHKRLSGHLIELNLTQLKSGTCVKNPNLHAHLLSCALVKLQETVM